MIRSHSGLFALVVAASICAEACADVPTAPSKPASPPPSVGGTTILASLAITSFRMIEVQYPGYPGWYYAPEVEVRETSGLANAIVTRIAVAVPGVLGAPAYQTSKCVGAGTQMPLFREVYGDFELTIDHPGARSPGGSGTAEITFEDAFGRQGKVTATGPVVAGGFPTTYSNPPTSWGCSTPAAR